MSKLAAAIARDLLAERPSRPTTAECFACGRSYMSRKPRDDDDNTRFCSKRCQDAYDNGLPTYDPHYASKSNPRWYRAGGKPLVMGKHGFLIPCASCGKTFDSKGLRCCSAKCERSLGERQEVCRLKDEAGITFESKMGPKAKCQDCGGDIPRWRNGRKVPKSTRFCSPKCARNARKGETGLDGGLGVETLKKCPSNGALPEAPK